MLPIARSHRVTLVAAVVLGVQLPSGAIAQLAGGIDSRGGDVRAQVEQSYDASSAPAPRSGVHISGYLDSEVHLTDNVRLSGSPRVSDVGLDLTPTIVVTSETRRFTGNLGYYPTIQLFARSSDLDSVSQGFNGSGNLIVVPNWVFLSARAFGGITSLTGQVQGSASSGGLNGYNRNDTGFSSSYEVSPYVRHDFSGVGTLNASYTGSYTSTNGFGESSPGIGVGSVGNQGLGSPTSQQLLGLQSRNGLFVNQEAVDFTTGSYLGRINNDVRATGMQESGGGVSDGAERYGASDSVSYALFKFLSLSVTGGYESISYPHSTPQVRISDPVWGFGAKLIDGTRGVVAVSYGHHDGFDSPAISAGYQITPRFRVFGSYAEGLASSLEEFRGQVDKSGVDSFGRSISLVDNSPVSLSNSFFGTDTNVFRTRNANFGASLLYSRDVFTLSASRTVGKSIASGAGSLGAFSQSTQYLRFDWQHDLAERLAMNVGFSYGNVSRSGGPASGNTRSTVGSVGLTYGLSESVSVRAGYQLNVLDGGALYGGSGAFGSTGSSVQNLVFVGLRKSFQ